MMTVTREQIRNHKVGWKPLCPCCDNPLTFIYEGASGLISVKCLKCKHTTLIDIDSKEVFKMVKTT